MYVEEGRLNSEMRPCDFDRSRFSVAFRPSPKTLPRDASFKSHILKDMSAINLKRLISSKGTPK